MMLPQLENLAQVAIAHVLNSLPEGVLIAALAWLTLRLLPGQNSRTRFAVWFVALLTVAGLPCIGAFSRAHSLVAQDETQSLFTISNHWAFILFFVWLLGVAAAGVHLLLGILRLRSLRKTCNFITPADLNPALAEIARDFCSSRSVTIATSEALNIPSAIGFFHPMIVIPAWALRELTAEEFRVILLHEFAHLHRRDDWTNLLQKAVRALFIFHPAIWWIEHELSLEREMACDDHVLAETGNPRGYAKCLVALLERSFARRAWVMAQAAVRHASEARQRLARILDSNRTSSRRFGMPAIALAGFFSLACLTVVPQAPDLVAFVSRAPEIHASTDGTLRRLKVGQVEVVPTAMHMRTSEGHRAPQQASLNCAEVPHTIAAKAKPAAAVPHVVNASKRGVATETILVIRTTEQIGPDAWISHVTVWHLMWAPSRAQRVPASKTT